MTKGVRCQVIGGCESGSARRTEPKQTITNFLASRPASGPLLLSVLKRAIDLAHKSVGLHASMSPTRVEVCCGMFGQDLTLGSTPIDRMFHTIANGHDHISESFDARPLRNIPSRPHATKSDRCPSVERVHQAVQCAALCGIDRRIPIARKHLAEVDQVGHMKMHDRVRVAVPGLLVNHMNRLAVNIEGEDFGESYTRGINS